MQNVILTALFSVARWDTLESCFWYRIGDVVSNALEIYPVASISLFMCLGSIISTILQRFANEIDQTENQKFFCYRLSDQVGNKMADLSTSLKNWKQNYFLYCELMEQMNGSFGLVLAISITSQFIRTINKSFLVFSNLHCPAVVLTFSILGSIMALAKEIVVFSLTILISNQLKTKVFTFYSI